MAYDAVRKQVVMFGGMTENDTLADTWVWDGSSWRQQHPSKHPAPRAWASMTFDAKHGLVVLFGGGLASLNDTWTWDGRNWTQQHPAASPPPGYEMAMDYDAALGQVVLLAQPLTSSGPGPLTTQTWVWDGANWRQLHPAASPPDRSTAMAYDPQTQQIVLFERAQTWTFDGANWTAQAALGPPPSLAPSMAYDAGTRSVVLFGAGGPKTVFGPGTTWTWDGTAWTQPCPTATPPRLTDLGPMPAMAYDAAAQVLVVFGGFSAKSRVSNATWTWDGTTWAQWHAKA
jgi:hypothetical protein